MLVQHGPAQVTKDHRESKRNKHSRTPSFATHTRSHLLKDTRQFVKLLNTKCAKSDETVCRPDATEIFMSGRHPELVDAGIASLPGGAKT